MSSLTGMLPLVLMFVVLYFVMIRPQMKRQKEHRAMIDALAKGDEVATAGGIIGKVTRLSEGFLHIEIANNVEVQIQRSAVVGGELRHHQGRHRNLKRHECQRSRKMTVWASSCPSSERRARSRPQARAKASVFRSSAFGGRRSRGFGRRYGLLGGGRQGTESRLWPRTLGGVRPVRVDDLEHKCTRREYRDQCSAEH